MSVLPDGKVAKIEFCEEHIAPWNSHAAGMGSTAPEVTAWQAKVEAARNAYNARQAAKNAAKAATNDFNLAVLAMVNATADILKQIKTKAAISGDFVYSLAEIPVPASPSPVGPPGTPYGFLATLLPNGALGVGWKCDNPAGSVGTLYHVFRRFNETDEWTFIAGTGEKKFTDATVPQGVARVYYQVQAARSTAVGVAGNFIVNFGINSGGAMVASVTQQAPKLAA